MKQNAFLFLSLAAFFAAGFLLGAGSQKDKTTHSPVPFHYVDYPEEISEVSRDENHPDLFEGMVRNDTLFFGYVPVPEKEDTIRDPYPAYMHVVTLRDTMPYIQQAHLQGGKMYIKNKVWFNTHPIH